MWAAAVVLLDSVDSAAVAAALLVPVVPPVPVVLLVPAVPLVPVPHEPQLPALAPRAPVQLPPALRVLVLPQAPPGPLLHLLSLPLPQVVVESEVPVRLQGRQSFSAAMARSSPPTVQPTYERAPSTRSPPKGRPCRSACLNWMPVRG